MKPRELRTLIRDSTLSVGARFLYCLLDSYADSDGRNAYPSIETLCKDSGCDRKWIFKHLDELERAGWIHRGKRLGKSGGLLANAYTLYRCPKAALIANGPISADFGTNISAEKRHMTVPIDQQQHFPNAPQTGKKARKKYDPLDPTGTHPLNPSGCLHPKHPGDYGDLQT